MFSYILIRCFKPIIFSLLIAPHRSSTDIYRDSSLDMKSLTGTNPPFLLISARLDGTGDRLKTRMAAHTSIKEWLELDDTREDSPLRHGQKRVGWTKIIYNIFSPLCLRFVGRTLSSERGKREPLSLVLLWVRGTGPRRRTGRQRPAAPWPPPKSSPTDSTQSSITRIPCRVPLSL